MGFLCELFGFEKKSKPHRKQLRPARDPPEFKSGFLADTGILWVHLFRKLLIPKQVAADYSKEPVPVDCQTVLRQCTQARKAQREKCKCRTRCNKKEEPKLVKVDPCKEYRKKLQEEEKYDATELKAETFDTKNDNPSKCANRPSTTTIYCNKCHKCTRIIDCTGHKKE